ncbi:MAG: beta-mannosidase [Phycisphaerae bacterium]
MESQTLTRRQIMQAAAGAGVAMALAGCSSAQEQRSSLAVPASTSGLALNLAGDTWTMHGEGTAEKIPAIVPGATYTDLMRAKKIPNPYYREDSGKVQWVADKNWIYERTFDVPAELLAKPHIELKCHGLDTLATVWINSKQVGQANNMFRAWSFDVKPQLNAGTNTIRIKFDTLTPYVEKNREAYKKEYGINLSDARCWVRKAPYMWGWDWCRAVLTQGVWKPIEILAYDARITDVGIFQHHHTSGTVQLDIQTTVTGASANANARVRTHVLFGHDVVATASAPAADGVARCQVTISNPQLWWPNGVGDHPLYTVEAQLLESTGSVVEILSSTPKVMDTLSRRIGLRKVEVLPPQNGVAMHVQVNGVPVFVKGADWIPADNIPTRVTPETIRWYMRKAVECNFNFIRLWGGGYYEQDELFDLCDELGIMLQFEFKFANDTYPVHDKQWMDNLQTEIDQQVLRYRNHPSIVIWSGNNEIQYFKGYNHLFGEVIGGTVHRLLPGAFYEVGSGAAGSGDIHTWEVWFGMKPYSQYRTVEGFVTEFGMQSFPVPQTVRAYTDAADRTSLDTPVMKYHETSYSGPGGLARMQHYVHTYFGRDADDLDSKLWLTQINQAYGIRYGVEHWRRDMPRSMGATIWQYNDCWPAPTWSMTDYYRRFKAIQYQSKHFFAPILVSGIPDPKTGHAELHITSDRQKDVSGELRWFVTDMAGAVLKHGEMVVHIPARTSRLAHTLDLADLISSHGAANLLIWPEVRVGSRTVAENVLFFGRPLELKLDKPQLAVHVTGGGRNYHLQINANAPALWVWANVRDTASTYSDNFINLRPGRTAIIHITLEEPMTPVDFHRKLEVRSIYDIAPDMRA